MVYPRLSTPSYIPFGTTKALIATDSNPELDINKRNLILIRHLYHMFLVPSFA